MFGKLTEAKIIIHGRKVTALLDTGSTVSTISKSFYGRELSQFIEMKSLDRIVEIECAEGAQLPYEGYIEANIKTPGNSNALTRSIVLVVPNNQYSVHVQAFIGTNVLHSMMKHGERFLHAVALTNPFTVYVIQMFDNKREGTSKEDL